ncbi:hypothetical protein AB4166_02685 [Vibrio splendidus]
MNFFKDIKDSVTNSVVETVDETKDYLKNTEGKEIAKDTAVLAGKAGLALGKASFYIGKGIVSELAKEGREVQRREQKSKQDAVEKAKREKEWEERKANQKPSAVALGLKSQIEKAKKRQADRQK